MSNKFLYTIFSVGILVFSTIILSVSAKITDITYPISELGNCNSQKECTDFCNNESNHMACISWAESEGIFTNQEAKRMKDINRMQEQAEGHYVDDPIYGPGNCTTPTECDAYCGIEENLDECLQFSVDNDYITSNEAIEIMAKRDRGGPGGCSSEEECNNYCSNPDNIEVCMDFVVEEGNITREEADFMIKEAKMRQRPMERPISPGGDNIDVNIMDVNKEKILQILSTEEGPGGCKTIDECADFCNNISRSEECMAFAKKHQLISQERIERVEKMMNMVGPGGCKGPEECDAYCDQAEHMDECFNFVKNNDLMAPMDIDKMKKAMDLKKRLDLEGGPGGCRGQEECDAYCSQEEHKKECMDFSVDTGMITQEDRQRMEIIEEKMMRVEVQNIEEGTIRNEVHQDNIMPSKGSQDYDQMFPGENMHPDVKIDYDESVSPSDGEVRYDNTIQFPDNDPISPNNEVMYPEIKTDYDESVSPSNDEVISPEGTILLEGDVENEEMIFNSAPYSEGLFHSLLNQVRNLLAAISLFTE